MKNLILVNEAPAAQPPIVDLVRDEDGEINLRIGGIDVAFISHDGELVLYLNTSGEAAELLSFGIQLTADNYIVTA